MLLCLTAALAAAFYTRMPEQVAYHFRDSSPDRWLGRGVFIAWMVLPQLLFLALAFMLVRVVLLTTRYWTAENTLLKSILPVMGNMVALPQLILTFALLQIFLYNAYDIKLIPLWVFALIIMVLGGLALGVFFVQTFRKARRQRTARLQE